MGKKAKRVLDLTILQQNFAQCNNGVNYDVQMVRPDTCKCGEIHKCWIVASHAVSSVDVTRINDRLFSRTKEDSDIFLKYCFHRILTRSELSKPKNWAINTTQSLYGQAIDTVLLRTEAYVEVTKTLNKLLTYATNLDRILFVIRREFDFSLAKFRFCRIETMPLEDLTATLNLSVPSSETIIRYNGYSLPRCVCLKYGSKYRIIDGLKRLSVSKYDGQLEVDAIILEE